MPEHDNDENAETIAEILNYEEAHPWHAQSPCDDSAYEFRTNGWVHVPDDPDVPDGPYCPNDALDALEHCGRLACMIAHGETVSPEEARAAAGLAVRCLAYYQYEQQPWFTEAWPFVKDLAEDEDEIDDEELDELFADPAPNGRDGA